MPRRKLPGSDGRRNVRRVGNGPSSFPIRTVAWTLLLAAVLVGVFAGIRMYTSSSLPRSDRVTFAVQTDRMGPSDSGVYLISYLRSQRTLTVVTFPEGTQVAAAGGAGYWKVESLYPLGEIDGVGGALFTKSLTHFFGAEVHGWLVGRGGEAAIEAESAREGLRSLLWQTLRSRADTNFGLLDRVFLLWAVSSVRSGKVEWIDLTKQAVLSKRPQPDGTTAYVADSELLDSLSQRLLFHPELVREGLAIAVFNATDHRGLGATFARIVQNSGGTVVSVSDRQRKQEETSILGASGDLLDSFTAHFLSRLAVRSQSRLEETPRERADIIVVLGEEYWAELSALATPS